MRYPLDGLMTVTSKFGFRMNDGQEFHRGTDYRAPQGTPFYSIVNGGKVRYVGFDIYRGKNLIIEYGSHCLRFNHCSEILVNEGDIVNENTVVALSGNTGMSIGAHMHLEVHACSYARMFETWPEKAPKYKCPRHVIDPEKFFLEYIELNNALEDKKNLIDEVDQTLNKYK